jgi:hypothetical protein
MISSALPPGFSHDFPVMINRHRFSTYSIGLFYAINNDDEVIFPPCKIDPYVAYSYFTDTERKVFECPFPSSCRATSSACCTPSSFSFSSIPMFSSPISSTPFECTSRCTFPTYPPILSPPAPYSPPLSTMTREELDDEHDQEEDAQAQQPMKKVQEVQQVQKDEAQVQHQLKKKLSYQRNKLLAIRIRAKKRKEKAASFTLMEFNKTTFQLVNKYVFAFFFFFACLLSFFFF